MAVAQERTPSLDPIVIDRENLMTSLVEVVAGLPDGQSNFTFDEQTNTLQPILQPRQSGEWPIKAVSLLKQQKSVNADAGHLITIAHPEVIHNLWFETPHFYMEVCAGRLVAAEFTAPLAGGSLMEANFTEEKERVRIYLSLIRQLDSFNLIYGGDGKAAVFQDLNGYTPEQLALVFKDGRVPDLDLQKIMLDTLLLNKRDAGKPALPQLTFNPNRYAYNPGHSRVYLVQSEASLPFIQMGSVIGGVAKLIDRTEQPFEVKVVLNKIQQIRCQYTDGVGLATRISGDIYIKEGRLERVYNRREFVVLSDLEYLNKHLELIPGKAFEQFHP